MIILEALKSPTENWPACAIKLQLELTTAHAAVQAAAGQVLLVLWQYNIAKTLQLRFKNTGPFRNRHTYLYKLVHVQETNSFCRSSFYFAKNLLLTVVQNIPKT